jgi:hypothetical protein
MAYFMGFLSSKKQCTTVENPCKREGKSRSSSHLDFTFVLQTKLAQPYHLPSSATDIVRFISPCLRFRIDSIHIGLERFYNEINKKNVTLNFIHISASFCTG